LANQQVSFSDRCDYYRRQGMPNGERQLGSAATDANGRVTLRYLIPKNVNVDNVSLIARFAGTASLKAAEYTVTHVEIGRSK